MQTVRQLLAYHGLIKQELFECTVRHAVVFSNLFVAKRLHELEWNEIDSFQSLVLEAWDGNVSDLLESFDKFIFRWVAKHTHVWVLRIKTKEASEEGKCLLEFYRLPIL